MAKVTEHDMVALWTRVLGRPVSATDDFFVDLGGNSIEALQVLDAVTEEFGVFVPPGTLFEQPTPSALAAALDGGDAEPVPPRALDQAPGS